MRKNFKKIMSIVLTALMLVGTMSALVPMTVGATGAAAEPVYLKKNETATINGVTYRFDTNTSKNPDSWARVNPDGTWELSYRAGDILWFPEIELTADSEVRMDVTNTAEVAQEKVVSGLAYAVTANSQGGADKMVIANTHTGGRLRIANSTFTSNNTQIPNDGFNGEGGKSDKVTMYTTEYSNWANNGAWKKIINGNLCIKSGMGVTYSVKKTAEDKATVSYGSQKETFVTKSLSSSTYAFEGGAVGFTAVYSYNETYGQTQITDLTVKNCKIGDDKVAGFSLFGEVVAPHTNVTVDGKVYRFDPLSGSDFSVCVLKPDGTFRVTLQAGDLFWMPETSNIENGAFLSARMIENNNRLNTGNIAAGLAYDIELGENGVWGDDDDSLINAHTQTTWRRRICSSTVAGRNTACTKLGVQSTHSIEEARRNEAYLAWGERWECGKITNYSLSINDEGNCYVSFMDENNVEMTYDYYAIDESARKVMDGPIGFYAFWDGDGNERGYMTVEILDLHVVAPDYVGVSDAMINLSLDGTIGLNLKFNADAGVPAGATVVATKNGEVVKEQAVVNGENVITAPVAAKEMNDKVNFSIMVDGELFEDKSYTASVAEYAADYLDDAEWGALIAAMLNYGAAAQVYFNYKAEGVTVTPVEYDTDSIAAVDFEGDTSILQALSVNLSLESDTVMKIYFKPAEGVTLDVVVDGTDADLLDNKDGFYVLSIDGIAADELSFGANIVVNGELSFKCSALNWVKIAAEEENADLVTLAKALAVYADEAAKKI